ncbi:hypothetical protein ACFVUS_26920 [Nocardia sp. NPDC058058]|uniref:hypothetical protein n=1 Tax=Nocardia sp. NPDC058058 TaxID=3346317 RepID=UPI0036D95FE2
MAEDIGREKLPPDAVGRSTMTRAHLKVGMDQDGRVWIQDTNSSNGTRASHSFADSPAVTSASHGNWKK